MNKWSTDALETAFKSKGWNFTTREINYGIQFELDKGVRVNLFHTGKFSFGGPKSNLKSDVERLVNEGLTTATSRPSTVLDGKDETRSIAAERRVFVVYGHDTAARNDLELTLRRFHTNPIILENIPGIGDTLIEKLESLTDADFACVLLTPDDIGTSKNTPDKLRPRARQNVVLELGMVLSRLGRHRVAILVKGSELEKPSDIAGLIYIPFKTKVSESANLLGAALVKAGFQIDIEDILGS